MDMDKAASLLEALDKLAELQKEMNRIKSGELRVQDSSFRMLPRQLEASGYNAGRFLYHLNLKGE